MEALVRGLAVPDNNVRAEAEACLVRYRTEKYPEYLADLLGLLERMPPRSLERQFAYVYLYREGNDEMLFADASLLGSITSKLMGMYPVLLASEDLPNFKKMIGSLLAKIAHFAYSKSKDTSIQEQFLKLLSEHGEFEVFITDVLTQLVAGDECNGVPLGAISAILGQPMVLETFVPRFQLFLALCTKIGDQDQMHANFMLFWEQLPKDAPEIVTDFLRSLADFAETEAGFFHRHLDVVIPMLCQLALNTNAPHELRVNALMCFVGLANCEPLMCRTSPAFYQNVMRTLIRMAAEDPDEGSEGEYDPNDNTISSAAVDAMEDIMSSAGSEELLMSVLELMAAEVIGKTVDWRISYGFVQVFVGIDISSSYALLDPTVRQKLLTELMGYANSGVLKLRVASLKAIEAIVGNCVSTFLLDEWNTLMASLIQYLDREQNPVILQVLFSAASAMCCYRSRESMNGELIVGLYQRVLEKLAKGQQEMVDTIPIMLDLMTRLLGIIGNAASATFGTVMDILRQLLKSTNIGVLVATLCAHVDLMALSEPYRSQAPALMPMILQVREKTENKDQLEQLDMSLNRLFAFQNLPLPAYQTALQVFLPEATKDIEIKQFGMFEQITVSRSVWTKIPTENSGVKCYADSEEIKSICRAFSAVGSCLRGLGPASRDFIPSVTETLTKWLNHPYLIEDIMRSCFSVALQIFKLHPDGEKFNLLVRFFGCAAKPNLSMRFVDICIIYMGKALSRLIRIGSESQIALFLDESVRMALLTTFQDIIEQLSQHTLASVGNYEAYDPDAIDGELDEELPERSAFISLISLLSRIFTAFGTVAQQFFAERIAPKMSEALKCPQMFMSSVGLLTMYFCKCNLRREAMEMLGVLLRRMQSPELARTWPDGLQMIGHILNKFPFQDSEQQHAEAIKDFFDTLCGDESQFSEPFENPDDLWDQGLVAYTKFVKQYYGKENAIFDDHTLIKSWWDCFPLHDAPVDAYLVYDLLARVLEDGNEAYLGGPGDLRLLMEWMVARAAPTVITPSVAKRLCDFFRAKRHDQMLGPLIAEVIEDFPSFVEVLEDPTYHLMFRCREPPAIDDWA